MSRFKDLFSTQSAEYAKFRPTYPDSLFEYLASLCSERELAWDCATGNGQAAVQLARHFKKVIATDPSEKQISSASPAKNVEYRIASAESSGLPTGAAELVTVAQAFHWFDQPRFFAEAKRVLKPGGVLAFWSYNLARITPEIDRVVRKLHDDILGSYWEPNRKLVDEGYRNISVPFKELAPPKFEMTARWNLGHLVGYLGTWSSLHTYIKKHGENPLEALYPELEAAWGDTDEHRVTWDLSVRVSRT